MIDSHWQEVHDLLIEIAESATQQGDPTAGAYLQLLVRLHNLYPEVTLGLGDDTRQQVMADIHEVIVQTLSALASDADTEQN